MTEVVFYNVWRTKTPDDRAKLLAKMRAEAPALSAKSGFRSMLVSECSDDGRILVEGRWASRDAFDAAVTENADAQAGRHALAAFGTPEPGLFTEAFRVFPSAPAEAAHPESPAPARSASADPLPDPPDIEGLESRSAEVGGVTLHFWIGGSGEPVVLLHGWPETGYAWRRVAPRLVAAGYQAIVPDLRGFGNSSRPAEGYDRMTMAEDVRRLVREQLRLGPLLLVGHDWGGSTAAAWTSAHPDEVRRLVVVEAQPRGPWSKPEPWFYTFHRAPGFPEAMTAGRERTYLAWFYRSFAARPDAITDAEIDVYLRTYGSPEGMRPGFELVRALARDVQANTEAAKHPVRVPTLGIGGERGMGSAVADNLRPLFTDVRGKVIADAGHFVPEEAPEALLQELEPFLSQS